MKASATAGALMVPVITTSFGVIAFPYRSTLSSGIGPDHAAGQVDSGKQPLRSRVREDLGRHLRIGCGARIAADGPGGGRRFDPERDLVAQQLLHALAVHHQQHQVNRLRADLQPPAALFDPHEDGRAPFAVVTATHQALAILAADDQRRLLEAGHHDDARSLLPEVLGDVLIGHAMNLSKHGGGLLHAGGFLGGQVRRLCRDRQPEYDRRNSCSTHQCRPPCSACPERPLFCKFRSQS